MSAEKALNLTYHGTSFSQGRMDFSWETLSDKDREQAYADWEQGKGLIGGDPRRIPDSDKLPGWAIHRPFMRVLALNDVRSTTAQVFQKYLALERPLEIEIGFGRGDFLLDRAQKHPQKIFLGYEVKTKAARLCLKRIEQLALQNVWLSDDDVRFSLPRLIPDGRVSVVHILFPDPWWKDQHRSKRLFSPPFVDLLARTLAPGGVLYFKSDVEEYGAFVRHLLNFHKSFVDHNPDLASIIGDCALTHRESWCLQHNKPCFSYYYQKVS